MAGTVQITLTVNGHERTVTVPFRKLLADVLREDLQLTGTHLGCEHGVCGACTVILDDRPVRSCLMFAVQANGASIMTTEGLANGAELHPLQAAFREHHALQCGFCTPGMLTTLHWHLNQPNADVSETGIRMAISGNLCRCTGYHNIVKAAMSVAESHGRNDVPGGEQV